MADYSALGGVNVTPFTPGKIDTESFMSSTNELVSSSSSSSSSGSSSSKSSSSSSNW